MNRGPCLNCAPAAWDYPPRGSVTASCGHRLSVAEGGGELITSWDWDGGDMVETAGCYCTWCAIRLKVSGLHIKTWVSDEMLAA